MSKCPHNDPVEARLQKSFQDVFISRAITLTKRADQLRRFAAWCVGGGHGNLLEAVESILYSCMLHLEENAKPSSPSAFLQTPGLQTVTTTCAISLQRAVGYADSAEVAKPFDADAECPHTRCVARQAVPGQARLMEAKVPTQSIYLCVTHRHSFERR